MHPAYSVIIFTTAAGAGYGLLVWVGLLLLLGALPPTPLPGIAMVTVALALVVTGLLSSTLHLGRPERAWRAFAEWRTSWLSREGVLAMATFVPTLVLMAEWLLLGRIGRAGLLAAVGLVVLAAATVWATGMIYQSLPTIRAWSHPLVSPIYLALALATGGVLLNLLMILAGKASPLPPWLALAALAVGWGLKAAYWELIDRTERPLTPGDATGLGHLGKVRPLDPPHTQPNFVMREMGYEIARKHALKLRAVAAILLFAAPMALIALTVLAGGVIDLVLAALAAMSVVAGVLVERWLFFAEAQHIVTLYYGRERA
jgi:DMSO reductase anchor subunit